MKKNVLLLIIVVFIPTVPLKVIYADITVSTDSFMQSVKDGEDKIIEEQGKVNAKIIKKISAFVTDANTSWALGAHVKIEAWDPGFIIPNLCEVIDFKIWGGSGRCTNGSYSGHIYPQGDASIRGNYSWSAMVNYNKRLVPVAGNIFIAGKNKEYTIDIDMDTGKYKINERVIK